jgi:hypothetical protein
MKPKQKTNSMALHIWIAENGGPCAREAIYKNTPISQSILSRVLTNGHLPKFEARYMLYKLTGIKLSDEDHFPELQRQDAS